MGTLKCKIVYVICICFVISKNLAGQNAARLKKNIVHIEAATKGPFYTINYERIFSFREKVLWSYRVGGFVGNNGIAVPIGINAIIGKQKHHAEISFVAIPYIDHYRSLWNGKNSADKQLYLSPTAGYRYQKAGGRLYFKISAGPVLFLDPPSDDFWEMQPEFYFIGACSLGVSF